jgi:hypothetical protein
MDFLVLFPLLCVVSLAMYYTLFKFRSDFNKAQEKIASTLLEIQKVLEKK